MRSQNGFTLIEMLVVIIIISILAAITAAGVSMAITASKKSNTESMVLMFDGALESYQTRWGDYPPSSLSRFPGGTLPNQTNNGIEAMVGCLASTRMGGSLMNLPSEELYSNTDNDRVSKNITGWFFGNNELREVTDYFGNCLTYLHHKDYKQPKPEFVSYVFYVGAPPQKIKPLMNSSTQTFYRPSKFQIMSPGSDGKIGTSDDIHPW